MSVHLQSEDREKDLTKAQVTALLREMVRRAVVRMTEELDGPAPTDSDINQRLAAIEQSQPYVENPRARMALATRAI